MFCHFVKKCPIFLLVNDLNNPLRGLANGTQGYLYNIDWKNIEIRNEALEYIRMHHNQHHVMILPWNLAPTPVITMVPVIKNEFINAWEENLTTIQNEIVLSIPFQKKKMTVTPVINNRFIVFAHQKPMYEIGLMSTVHKAQDRTIDYLVFSVLKRVGPPTREDFFAVNVLLTRIRRGENFRVIANPQDLDFLDDLNPPDELTAFLHAYDENGVFHHVNALTEYERLQQLHNTLNNNGNYNNTTASTTATTNSSTRRSRQSTSNHVRRRRLFNENPITNNAQIAHNRYSNSLHSHHNNIHQDLHLIINDHDNILRAANEVNDHQIVIDVNYPEITLPLAIQIRNMYGNLSAPLHMITNSSIYVPIIRASQNLTYQIHHVTI